ncbi:MAG TPA: hypothetical protein VF345_05550 [Chthoniobacterales bacterium]
MERDWVGELERWLQDRFAELCETIGHPVPLSGLRINPALGLEESEYFLLGLEAGLFQPDEEGYVQSELLPAPSTRNTRQTMCQIFWHDPPPPRLFRECVCQLSTASSLIMKRGWLKSHILMEPDFRDDRDMSYGIDILVKSPTGEILACVEVKRSVAELQKLITDLRACCKRGAHAKDDCGFPQNHPNYEFCAFYKPTYFWAVAPDADVCFRMKYDDGSIELEQLISLPPRSMIESH